VPNINDEALHFIEERRPKNNTKKKNKKMNDDTGSVRDPKIKIKTIQ